MTLRAYALAGFALLMLSAAPRFAAELATVPPPSPFLILRPDLLDTPPIDAPAVCIPADLESGLERAVVLARQGHVGPALRVIDGSPSLADHGKESRRVFHTALVTRLETDAALRGTLTDRLARDAQSAVSPHARTCARLEVAKLHLDAGRHPEASAEARMARRIAEQEGGAPAVLDSADFYRAEGLYLSGWRREADALYRSLLSSESPRIAAASRLRVADIVFDVGDRATALPDYESLVARADLFGAREEAWALRASEAAVAAGKYPAAEKWLRRYLALRAGFDGFAPTDAPPEIPSDVPIDPEAPLPEDIAFEPEGIEGETPEKRVARLRTEAGALAEIRLADIEALRSKAITARVRLDKVAGFRRESLWAELARVRAVDLGIDRRPASERVATAKRLARVEHRALSAYALGVLVHEYVREERIDDALATLTRLLYESVPGWLTPHLQHDLERALRLTTRGSGGDEECVAVVRRLGGRYTLLAAHAEAFEPFAALGECYERLGLTAIAGQVYRALVRISGGEAADLVALPLARTALAEQNTSAVRTAAAGQVRRRPDQAFEWLLLLGEAELVDGRYERAAELLRDLVSSGKPDEAALRAIRAFANAVVSGRPGGPPANVDARPSAHSAKAENLALLTKALTNLAPQDRESAAFDETTLLVADIQRRVGDVDAAKSLYRLVSESSDLALMRATAQYWLAALDGDLVSAGEAWRRIDTLETATPWRSLASFEARMQELRTRFGTWPVTARLLASVEPADSQTGGVP